MDKGMVKKVLTHKSGQFVFSRKFSDKELSPTLIKAKVLYYTISDLPILPGWAAKIEEEVVIRSIFGTAAIEGNPLTEEKVAEIIAKPETTDKYQRAEKEIRNLKSAYDRVKQLTTTETFNLSEDIVKELHDVITKDIEYPNNIPGQYRDHRVKVGNAEHGGVYTPPKIRDDITTLMKEFTAWINSKELLNLDPGIRAALAHYHLALIHPFGDGNGRTARIVEALLLLAAGIKYAPIMLSNFYYRNLDDYFWAFSNSIRNKENDLTPFLKFVSKGIVESLCQITEKIIFYTRFLVLQDYYRCLRGEKKITQRQYDLLNVLLDSLQPFTFEDVDKIPALNILYRNVSERTVKRDLKRLVNKDLLVKKNNQYELHLRVLG